MSTPLQVQGTYINMPVADLSKSRAFFEALGFAFNADFSNDQGACLMLGAGQCAMLLTHSFFDGFITKPRADAHAATGMLVAIQLDSRAAVESMMATALAHGAKENKPPQVLPFMYSHSFVDLDGHVWEPLAMLASTPT